jgi:hypothetical protein
MDGTEETIKETVAKKDDGILALAILVVAIVAVILFGIRYYRQSNKKTTIDPRYDKQRKYCRFVYDVLTSHFHAVSFNKRVSLFRQSVMHSSKLKQS